MPVPAGLCPLKTGDWQLISLQYYLTGVFPVLINLCHLHRIYDRVIFLILLLLFGCSNFIINEEQSCNNSVSFSLDNSLLSNRTIAPQNYVFDFSKINSIKVYGYQKEEENWSSNASISKNYTTYKSFTDDR